MLYISSTRGLYTHKIPKSRMGCSSMAETRTDGSHMFSYHNTQMRDRNCCNPVEKFSIASHNSTLKWYFASAENRTQPATATGRRQRGPPPA